MRLTIRRGLGKSITIHESLPNGRKAINEEEHTQGATLREIPLQIWMRRQEAVGILELAEAPSNSSPKSRRRSDPSTRSSKRVNDQHTREDPHGAQPGNAIVSLSPPRHSGTACSS